MCSIRSSVYTTFGMALFSIQGLFNFTSRSNANAKPAIMIHQGSADTNVPPAQGEKTRDFWAAQNGCEKTTTSSFASCKSYSGCARPVVYCPGSWTHTIDPQAASNIWSFFSGF
jgi:hypothetical protein